MKLKQLFCSHSFVLKVNDQKWKERIYKCSKCGKVKSEFY